MTTVAAALPVTSELLEAGGLRLEVAGALATLTLDRPERRNAMTPTMWLALGAVPALLPPEVRVVLIQGAGSGFCAGLDLRLATPDGVPGEGSLASLVDPLDDAGIADLIGDWQRGFTWLRDPRWISIAAVHGSAVGAGFQLALAADLRIATTDARFCMRENALGLIPDMTGTKTLFDAVGYARALEICASARWVDAAEAAALGIVTSVVEPDALGAAAQALAAALLANSVPAGVAVKELLLAAGSRDVAAQALAERTIQVPMLRAMAERVTGS
ncbi:MAG: enoyl-CoA hydratase/isomerase family protein [Sporichthyaceae bacterium]